MIKEELIKNFKSTKFKVVLAFLLVLAVIESIDAIYYVHTGFYGDAHPAFVSLLANNNNVHYGSIFIWLMPIFLTLSYCDKYNIERKKGINSIYLSKLSRKRIYFSRLAAAFINAVCITAVPLIINLFINMIFMHGNIGCFGQEDWTLEMAGPFYYYSSQYPYIAWLVFDFMAVIIFGFLGILCQGLCIALKDNRFAYIVCFAIWMVYFSGGNLYLYYIIGPFGDEFNLSMFFEAWAQLLIVVFIGAALGYFVSVVKKDEI